MIYAHVFSTRQDLSAIQDAIAEHMRASVPGFMRPAKPKDPRVKCATTNWISADNLSLAPEALRLSLSGLSHREVGNALGISKSTASRIIRHAMGQSGSGA